MMYGLFLTLMVIANVANLVCFILVLVKMFQANETTLGIVCIVLALCTGIGTLIAFIYGWIRATQWNIKNVMIAWTAIWILSIISVIGFITQLGSDVSKLGRELQQEINKQKSR
jgi:hypothetical protein